MNTKDLRKLLDDYATLERDHMDIFQRTGQRCHFLLSGMPEVLTTVSNTLTFVRQFVGDNNQGPILLNNISLNYGPLEELIQKCSHLHYLMRFLTFDFFDIMPHNNFHTPIVWGDENEAEGDEDTDGDEEEEEDLQDMEQ
jgi:hypothetical protein